MLRNSKMPLRPTKPAILCTFENAYFVLVHEFQKVSNSGVVLGKDVDDAPEAWSDRFLWFVDDRWVSLNFDGFYHMSSFGPTYVMCDV